MNTQLDFSELSAAAQGRVDDACDAIEAAWQRVFKRQEAEPATESACPALSPCLAKLPDNERAAALNELVPIDVFYRRLCRVPVSIATYAQFPELDAEWLADIVLHGGGQTRKVDISTAAAATNLALAKPHPPTVDVFIQRLVQSTVLDRKTVERELAAMADDQQTAIRVGERLVAQGLLTPFQFSSLLRNQNPGLVLGEYLILSPLGRGGMGAVYRAKHRRMDRIVAIKVLPRAAAGDPQAATRFAREIRAVSRLSHPNIVAAHDAGEDAGVLYLVMECIAGIDLSTWVRTHSRLSVAHAVECMAQSAAGLEYAHRQGVIHRDIKPSNLILCLDQATTANAAAPLERDALAALPSDQLRIKVLDLGLARFQADAAQEGSALTQAGVMFGTPEYMAPEQAVNASSADQRSDIYSLGCTLYFLLVGRPVLTGQSFLETAMAHQLQELPSLSASRVDVPEELEQIFRRMTARQPDQRYASMQDVCEALRAIPADRLSRVPGAAVVKPMVSAASRSSVATDWFAPLGGTDPTRDPTVLVTGIEIPSAENLPGVSRLRFRTGSSLHGIRPTVVATLCGCALIAGVAWWNWSDNGSTATRQSTRPGTPAARTSPEPLVCPADELQVRRSQSEWATFLGTESILTNDVGMQLCLIPPGEFLMGSSEANFAILSNANLPDYELTQIERNEFPAHRVQITRPFWISRTEVTVGQYRQFVDTENYLTETERMQGYGVVNNEWVLRRGFSWKNVGEATIAEDHPASNLTWNDAVAFAEWLSQHESQVTGESVRYRLPTEAEWEYACRAGTDSLWYFGSDPRSAAAHAIFLSNSQQGLHTVGSKRENAFRLFDMAGNQSEWCQDWFAPYSSLPAIDPGGPLNGQVRVQRGGNFGEPPVRLRSAARQSRPPSSPRDGSIRLVRDAV